MTLSEERPAGGEDLARLVQPSGEMQKRIRCELNENVATRDSDLQRIKEWLALQPHLPPFNDDQRLMTFLRGCKFSLEKTKRKLDMYFTMRAAVPEFFTNRDVTRPELKEILDRVMTLSEERPAGGEDLARLVQPSGEMQKRIRCELNENVATRDSDLQRIKEWLALQPHLPPFNDDQRLMTFLRGCKFSLEKTKRKLDMYFTMRAAVPEFFTNRDVTRPELKEILDRVCIPTLPGLTPNGRRVTLLHGKVKDYLTPNVADGMKLLLMIGDIRLHEEQTGVAGDVYILDAAVATPAYFAKFTPAIVKKFLVCVQDAYPVKLKEVHVINTHPLVDTIYNFVKPFLKEKIRQRINFHGSNLEALYKSIPKDILPNEYGGSAGPIEAMHNAWVKKMESYTPWFKEQEKMVADESRRPGRPKNYDDLFGMEGSFRKLSID